MLFELQKTIHERQPSAPVRLGTTLARNINGTVVTLTALDVNRSYLGTGLHANAVISGGGGLICLLDAGSTLGEATRGRLEALLDTVKLCSCAECGKPAFDPMAHPTTNRGGQCERCFLTGARKKLKEDLAAEQESQTTA